MGLMYEEVREEDGFQQLFPPGQPFLIELDAPERFERLDVRRIEWCDYFSGAQLWASLRFWTKPGAAHDRTWYVKCLDTMSGQSGSALALA
jgi:hypothetical protein